MISLQLWAALRRPFVAHPIYQRWGVWRQVDRETTSLFEIVQNWIKSHQNTTTAIIFALAVIITILFGPAPVMIILFGIPFLIFFIALPAFLISVGTLYGLAVALATGDAIANEQVQGRYGLMGITPYGLFGATWALCTLEFHRHEWFLHIRHIISGIYLLIGAFATFPLFFTFMMYVMATDDPVAMERFFNVIMWLLIIFTPGLDFVQSTMIGCLVGMIAPVFSSGRANTRGFTMALFLSLQFGTYIIVSFFVFFLWPYIYYRLGWQTNITYLIISIITLVICRDILTWILWVVLARGLDAELEELEAITQVGIRKKLFGL